MPIRNSTFLLCSILFSTLTLAAQSKVEVVPQPTVTVSSGTPLNLADRKALITKARKAYYSLKAEGMQEYRFDAALDWKAFFDSIQADQAARDKVLPMLQGVKFKVVVGPTGASTVSSQSDTAPPDQEAANRLSQMTNGVETMLRGFLQSWAGYSITPLMPEVDGDYAVVDLGSGYKVTYKEGDATLVLTLRRDLSIDRLDVASAAVNATLHSKFDTGSGGFLLSGYEADYKEGDSTSHLKVVIQHGPVNGLQVPIGIQATTTSPSKTYTFSFTFVDPQIKKL